MRNDKLYQALWKKTFMLVKRRWFYFLKISAVFFVPLHIVDTYFWQNTRLVREVINQFSLKAFFVVDDIIKFIMVVVFILYITALLTAIHIADRNQKLSVSSVYKGALDMLGPYLWVHLLLLWKILWRSLLLLLPGIMTAVYGGFAGLALLIDQKRGGEALVFSRDMIKPNIMSFLKCACGFALFLLAECVLVIITLDSLVILCRLNDQWFAAGIFDCLEAIWLACTGFVWQIFYYYLYQELKPAAQEMS